MKQFRLYSLWGFYAQKLQPANNNKPGQSFLERPDVRAILSPEGGRIAEEREALRRARFEASCDGEDHVS